MPSTVTQIKPASLGARIDKLFDLREKKRVLDAQITEIELVAKEIELELIAAMDSEETNKAGGRKASASITSSQVGNVEDWDALNAYIRRHKAHHLVQKRLSDPAVREIFALKGKLPGVVLFNKRKLNLAKI